jgi:RimJ/RimL family protein N-acetyltransferase
VSEPDVRLRPVVEDDLEMFRRFATEPHLIGLDWAGFRDAQEPARRFATTGFLTPEESRLIVELLAGQELVTAGFVGWRSVQFVPGSPFWEIGIVLLPQWRGHGIGWRAQAMLCDYLFRHTPVQRIQAGTHPENIAEQKSLEKAGFRLEGVTRAIEFREGQWRDGWLYSRLRDDPASEDPGHS